MQRYCTELTDRLLKSLDKEYNVVDMGAVVDVITALEKTTITKEVLEITRLGKYINELRRKTSNDALAKRAKDLVRRWRGMVLPSAQSTLQPTPADPAPPALNGAKPHSPALRSLKPQSPALRGIKPQSPLMKDTTSSRTQVPSPALSVNSDHSRSPNSTPSKQTITVTSNHRLGPGESPRLGPAATQNHSTEAVPRTHSSNKRLRKDETDNRQPQPQPPPLPPPPSSPLLPSQSQRLTGTTTYCEPAVKKQRLNGENVSSHFNSQVPSPALEERCISDQFAAMDPPVDADSGVSGPKKRGRKKGSKSAKKQPPVEDRVKEKLASISRNPKLKTTQELLADLQARGSTAGVNLGLTPSQNKKKEPPSTEDILRSSNEQVSKYLRSARSDSPQDGPLQSRLKPGDNGRKPPPTSVKSHREADSDDVERTDAKSKDATERLRHDPTVEEILAKLPPLDPSTIEWSDPEEEEEEEEEEDEDDGDTTERLPRQVTPEDLERLHSRCIEGLNGNFQPKLSSLTSDDDRESLEMEAKVKSLKGMDSACEPSTGNETDTEFREWHEMLARPSYDGQILHILPYVIID